METGMDDATEKQLNDRLTKIHNRVQWIADAEARSTWVDGIVARGALTPEKMALLDETDRILDQLRELSGA